MNEETPDIAPRKSAGKSAADRRKADPESREERLRAALRANLQRRKAQSRGRAAADSAENSEDAASGGKDQTNGSQEKD